MSVRPYPPPVEGGVDGSVAKGSNDGSTTAGPLIPPIDGGSSSVPSEPVQDVTPTAPTTAIDGDHPPAHVVMQPADMDAIFAHEVLRRGSDPWRNGNKVTFLGPSRSRAIWPLRWNPDRPGNGAGALTLPGETT